MKIIAACFLSILIYQSTAAQSISLHKKTLITTVFDSVLVSKIGLNCNQYCNKVMNEYYKMNNYNGIKNANYAFYYNKEIPLIVINNATIDVSKPFKELQKYKELTAAKFLTFDEGGFLYGSSGTYGVFMFTAK